ncbi:hypothetical protein AB1Y20_017848 [Prymnesium parvum]|uniref:Saposin B-type domain-containing protein n=1 Tax=Prymnesium parvum TaxID=97485 RepID=A0AB34JPB0_PRYPA
MKLRWLAAGACLAAVAAAQGDASSYNSSTWEKLAAFSTSTVGDASSELSLRCSGCFLLASMLLQKFMKPKIYREFKEWEPEERRTRLAGYLQKACPEIRKMRIVQTGNKSEMIWEEYGAVYERGGSPGTVAMMPASSQELADICEEYVRVDLPDLVDRMSSFITKGGKRKQRIIDFKFREEICIEQFKFCPAKKKSTTLPSEEGDWDEDKDEL